MLRHMQFELHEDIAVDFSTRAEWRTGDVLQGCDTVFCTYGPKMVCGVDVSVF